jgi:antitoxin Phd
MAKQYSVAEARSRLPTLIREVEQGGPIEITRRGKPVVVVLTHAELRRMGGVRPRFREAWEEWRRGVAPEDAVVPPDFFDTLRDRSPGRKARL